MRPALAAVLASLTLCVGASAFAQTTQRIGIREVGLGRDGSTRIVVSVSGFGHAAGARDFVVRESGSIVRGLAAEPLADSSPKVGVVLVVDTSGSTRGRPLQDAKAAAQAFVRGLPSWMRVGVVAAGPHAVLASAMTTDRAAIARAIAGLVSAGETPLYDAVAIAAGAMRGSNGQHNIVVFSDGRDTVSRESLAGAVAAAKAVATPITTVSLQTTDLDPAALATLARETGGRTLPVASSGALEAAFLTVAEELSSQYVLTYTVAQRGPDEIDVRVALGTVSDAVVVLNSRRDLTRKPSVGSRPPSPRVALATGLAAAFLAVASALYGLAPLARRRQARVLEKALGPSRTAPPRTLVVRARTVLERVRLRGGSSAPAALPAMIRRRRDGARSATQTRIDLAGWPLRAADLSLVRTAIAAAGWIAAVVALRAVALPARVVLASALATVVSFVPSVVLDRVVRRRAEAFTAQLPDTLQLLAASLEAGYALVQGLHAVVKESPEPTSGEFSRALSEVRLGMRLQDALDGMARRLQSEDFAWIVVALNVQREVGGNLTVILKTLADTMRARAQLRRQVKVLSAEGRVSAIALGMLPVGLTVYLAVANPAYLAILLGSPAGRSLAIVAALLMLAGAAWMRRLVRIAA